MTLCESLCTKPHGRCVCQPIQVQFLPLDGFSETAKPGRAAEAPGVSADNPPSTVVPNLPLIVVVEASEGVSACVRQGQARLGAGKWGGALAL